MFSHPSVLSQLEGFLYQFGFVHFRHVHCSGSVQHTTAVIEYLVSKYNAFVVFQEVFIFLFDGRFPFCCIFDVLVFCFDSSANHLNVEPKACGSKPLLLPTYHCCGMVLLQFFSNCLTIKGVVAILNGLVFSS
jgi:hypothetical protein